MEKDETEEEEGEINGEGSKDAYTVTYVNRQPMKICYMTQELKLGLCINQEWLGLAGSGRKIQEESNICISIANSCLCMTEVKPVL